MIVHRHKVRKSDKDCHFRFKKDKITNVFRKSVMTRIVPARTLLKWEDEAWANADVCVGVRNEVYIHHCDEWVWDEYEDDETNPNSHLDALKGWERNYQSHVDYYTALFARAVNHPHEFWDSPSDLFAEKRKYQSCLRQIRREIAAMEKGI